MKTAFAFLFAFVLAITVDSLLAQPAAPGRGALAPTTQDLQQKLDAKRYPEVLAESQRMLALKGPAAKDIDKYEVLLLRAEAQMQLKQQSTASASYQQATKETADPSKAGVAKAMATLVQRSRAFMFTPKASSDPTKTIAPLNILDPTERKAALSALFDEEWTPTQAKIDAFKKQGATSLPPILQAADLAGEMRGLEIAATGKDTKTSTALSDLTENASKLMNDYLERATRDVEDIDRKANYPVDTTTYQTTRRGLTSPQMADLKTIISNCQRLTLAAQQVASSAGANGAAFNSIAGKSTDLAKRASEVLNADYSELLNNNNANNNIIRNGQPMAPPRYGR
ncbi:MAG TPA: hypothetical protein VHS31_00420 [Tepidisphaeraceae bacterium]|jgi:hypothetical protein|nr:hypothetical protein [Tepidisphaeraceae bacterium]